MDKPKTDRIKIKVTPKINVICTPRAWAQASNAATSRRNGDVRYMFLNR